MAFPKVTSLTQQMAALLLDIVMKIPRILGTLCLEPGWELNTFFKDCFDVDLFKKSLFEFVTVLLPFWFFDRKVCRFLSPQPRFEPEPPTLEGEVSTTEPPGKSLIFLL